MHFSLGKLATLAALVAGAAADLQVTYPGTDLWWVAKSSNMIEWTCKDSSFQNFTILVANSNPTILVSPIAIVAIESNFDCSKTITQDQSNQAPGTGYTILLANPLNSSDVYATSQPFEIKALGSAYPSTSSAAGTAGATGSNTAAGAISSSTDGAKSGALGLHAGVWGVVGALAGVLGAVVA